MEGNQKMKLTHRLAIKTGTYEKDGQTKNKYQHVGVIMEGDKGPFILLNKTFNPAGIQDGKESVIISMFEEKPKNENPNDFF